MPSPWTFVVMPKMWYSQHFFSLQAISVIVPVAAGFLVSMLGQKELLTWYKGLNKPKWQPPAFLFGAPLSSMLQLLNDILSCLHMPFMLQALPCRHCCHRGSCVT